MSITDPPTKPRLAPLSDLDAARLLGQVAGILQNELSKVIVGQRRVIDEILIAIFCRGHCLMQGVPGLAKTLLGWLLFGDRHSPPDYRGNRGPTPVLRRAGFGHAD